MYEKVKVILKKESKIFSWQFLMPLMLASSLNPLNSSMIATALPKISVSLDISAGTAAVLVRVHCMLLVQSHNQLLEN